MKRFIFLLLLISLGAKAQSPKMRVLFVDSAGYNQVASWPLPQVAISGYYDNLLHIPSISINGTSKSVIDGQSWVITGTPYTASAPLVLSSNNFSIPAANGTGGGYLSPTDWNTFNNKQSPLTAGTGINISGNNIINTAPDQTVVLTAGNGIVITGTYPNFTISQIAPTITTPTRTLNSNFTVSASKPAFVFYTVTCQVTNPLLVGNSTASCFLEYSVNSGTTWLPVTSIANSSGVGITVTLQLTNWQTGIIGGLVPTNALCRLRTVTSGTATVTFVSSQEVVY